VSQLCKTDANYMPNNIVSAECYMMYDTTAELDAEACVGGMKHDLSMGTDLNGDGQPDMFCYYFDVTTSSDCNAKFPNGLTSRLFRLLCFLPDVS